MKLTHAMVVVAAMLLGPMSMALAQVESPSGRDYEVTVVHVEPLEQPTISAAKAGQLMSAPKEGQAFHHGDILAQVDEQEALLNLEVAQYELENAMAQYNNDVDIRYAAKQSQLTAEELREAMEANLRVSDTFSDSEVRQRKFTHERSQLAEEQAHRDHLIARTTAKAADAKLRLAQADIELRKVRATVNGVAAEVFRHRGEWVNPGDPIVRLLRLDRMKFVGKVEIDKFRPALVQGKPVTVEVPVSASETRQLQGTITGVNPDVGADGTYRVWAEIDNPELPGGGYLANPGMFVRMVIHMRSS